MSPRAAALLPLMALATACTAPPRTIAVPDPILQTVLADMGARCVAIDFEPPDRLSLRRFMPGMEFSAQGRDLPVAQNYRIEAAATAAMSGGEQPGLRGEAPWPDRIGCGYAMLGTGDQVGRIRQPAIADEIAFVETRDGSGITWYVLDGQSGTWDIIAKASNHAI
ncbi:hypothetical protein PQ455_02185 [Sphingomonas naphthae]|uniref:Uncharacterized protein n=1 Tax=Sphingomonas naphthae TaxID=1813468 RepID=A0ABY7TLF9_9SPHN|nr:hypothetical protein [Sphingomonas naphthae]WCT74062.1 hypothetical protein PQ455_02185 [Sphingomonas naphthae]